MIAGVDEGPRFPWKGLLTRPRETLAIILDEDPTRHAWVMFLVLPALAALDVLAWGTRGASEMGWMLPFAVLCGLAATVVVAIVGFGLRWIGRLLGGSGDLARVVPVVSWALLPLAVAPLGALPLVAAPLGGSLVPLAFLLAWIAHGAGIVIGIAAAHRVSAPRATVVVAATYAFLGGIAYVIGRAGDKSPQIVGALILLVAISLPAALVIACWRGWRMAG